MNELITSLIEKAGITVEQATKATEIFKDFIKEKLPMMGGPVENLLAGEPVANVVAEPELPGTHGSMIDKISDVIPGETGQKVEDFVKDTAHKVEDAFDSLKDKVGGLFGEKKE